MSLASHGGGAQTNAEDQDAVSRLLQRGIAVIFFFNQRETGEIHGEGGRGVLPLCIIGIV